MRRIIRLGQTLLRQRTVAHLITSLCINTSKQADRPSNSSVKTNYRDSSSGRTIRLFARIYTQTNYQMDYRSLPKFNTDG